LRRPVGRGAAGAGRGRRVRAARPAGHCHYWWADRQPVPDPLHHAGGLPEPGALASCRPAGAVPPRTGSAAMTLSRLVLLSSSLLLGACASVAPPPNAALPGETGAAFRHQAGWREVAPVGPAAQAEAGRAGWSRIPDAGLQDLLQEVAQAN